MRERGAPDVMPILQTGRHRRPRDGACVMEYVSLLAGERFSDNPACVDAPLAALARAVNDRLSDGARQRLLSRVVDLIDTAEVSDDVRLRAGAAVLARAAELVTAPGDAFLVAVASFGLAGAANRNGVDVSAAIHDVLQAVTVVGGGEVLDRAHAFVTMSPYDAREYVRRGLPVALTGVVGRVCGEGSRSDVALLALLDVALAVYADARAADLPVVPPVAADLGGE